MKFSKAQMGQLFFLGLITLSGCKNSVMLPSTTSTTGSSSSVVPAPEQLCSSATGGQVILGVTGVGVCQSASGGANATAADVLAGKYFWDSTGASVLGTMAGGGGGSTFGDLTGSNMGRNVATAQITLTTEKTTTTGYPAGYREVPDVYKDDDGYWDLVKGCGGTGGFSDTCTTVVKITTRPSIPCGSGAGLNSIDLRIADCLTSNPATSSWSASANGISGEGSWKLVTLKGGKEVWRDERTGLLWGDTIAGDTWCHASGNGQANDSTCNGNTTSSCAEGGALTPAIAGEVWSTTPTYDDSKGGMGAYGTISSPSVRWRLPTKYDWMQAEIDGIRFVVPNIVDVFWSATVVSGNRDFAWVFGGDVGYFYSADRSSNYSVRCLGR